MLNIYYVIIDVVKALRPMIETIAQHDADLARQMRRALTSVPLSTAEVAPGKAWEEEA